MSENGVVMSIDALGRPFTLDTSKQLVLMCFLSVSDLMLEVLGSLWSSLGMHVAVHAGGLVLCLLFLSPSCC